MALGIVLILVGVALFVLFILGGPQVTVDFNLLGGQFHVPALAVFVTGAVATALVLIGARLFLNGARRDVRRMRKTRELKKTAETATRAAAEAALEAERAKEQAAKHQHGAQKKDPEPETPPAPEKPAQP